MKREELQEKAFRIIEMTPRHYVSGAKVPYRNRMITILLKKTDSEIVTVEYSGKFVVGVPKSTGPEEWDKEVEEAIADWIKKKVEEDCRIFARKYCRKLNISYKGLRVKEQKHLWGSCGKDLIININWKLGRAPKKVLEYVVAHEVCHLKYRNHSEEFWTLLRSVFGEVDSCRDWLEENGDEKYKA